MIRRLPQIALVALACLALTASAALSFWAIGGSGNGTGSAAKLTKPGNVAVPSGPVSGNVTVSWNASTLVPSITAGNNLIRYTVERSANSGGAWAAACGGATINGTSCSDSVPGSGNYIYRVTARLGSWTELSQNSSSVARKPDKPEVTGATGVATLATVNGTAEASSNVKLYTDNTCTTAALDSAGNSGASGTATGGNFSIQATVPAGQSRTFYATATANSLVSDCSTTSASYTAPAVVATPPTVTAGAIAKTEGLPNSWAGFIRAFGTLTPNLGTYLVYANVTPGSNAITAVTANTTSIGGGLASVPLTACSGPNCTVNGVTYNYVSAQQTAVATPANTYGFSVTALAGAQSHTLGSPTLPSALSVVVDNTVPQIASVSPALSTADAGGASPKPGIVNLGDTITFVYSEAIDPNSMLGSWSHPFSAANVQVVVGNNTAAGGNDGLTIKSQNGATTLPFGTISLGDSGYVTGNDVTFGASGTPSTIQRAGANNEKFLITLGTQGGSGSVPAGAVTKSKIRWTPGASNAAYDRAGNRLGTSAGVFFETGNDQQF